MFSVSSGLRSFGDCSARNVIETMKGISRDSTPSFSRSSAAIGGKSGERFLLSVGHAREGRDYDLLCGPWVPSDMLILEPARGNGSRK